VARRLIAAGADRLIINVHHHADRIIDMSARGTASASTCVSRRGGGAAGDRRRTAARRAPVPRDAPFFLHNVDVLCDASTWAACTRRTALRRAGHAGGESRQTTRYLLFDEQGLCGRVDRRGGAQRRGARPGAGRGSFAFAGVHVISPGCWTSSTERGAFSIMDLYLRLAAAGETIGRTTSVAPTGWRSARRSGSRRRARRWRTDMRRGFSGRC
jgi:N-acetyl-alpha-D-muramate 1-phosphate uridylyltransferase